MKKIIVLLVLAVMLITGGLIGLARAEDGVTYRSTLPYTATQDGNWWTGLAVTNDNDQIVTCKILFLGGGDGVYMIIKDIPPYSVKTMVLDVAAGAYLKLSADLPLFYTIMIGDGNMMQGFQGELLSAPDAASETGAAY